MNVRKFGPWVVALLSSVLAVVPSVAAEKYNQEDLDALLKQRAYGEFLQHANDIRPSKRNAAWKKGIETAVLGELTHQEKQVTRHFSAADYDAFLTSFPSLRESETFLAKRTKVALGDLKRCLDNRWGQTCSDMAKGLLETDPKNHIAQMESGRLLRIGFGGKAAIPHFHAALKNAPAKERSGYCKDEQVPLALRHTFHGPKSDFTDPAIDIVAKLCVAEVSEVVMDMFLDGSPYAAEALCPTLIKLKRLTPFQKAHCKDKGASK